MKICLAIIAVLSVVANAAPFRPLGKGLEPQEGDEGFYLDQHNAYPAEETSASNSWLGNDIGVQENSRYPGNQWPALGGDEEYDESDEIDTPPTGSKFSGSFQDGESGFGAESSDYPDSFQDGESRYGPTDNDMAASYQDGESGFGPELSDYPDSFQDSESRYGPTDNDMAASYQDGGSGSGPESNDFSDSFRTGGSGFDPSDSGMTGSFQDGKSQFMSSTNGPSTGYPDEEFEGNVGDFGSSPNDAESSPRSKYLGGSGDFGSGSTFGGDDSFDSPSGSDFGTTSKYSSGRSKGSSYPSIGRFNDLLDN